MKFYFTLLHCWFFVSCRPGRNSSVSWIRKGGVWVGSWYTAAMWRWACYRIQNARELIATYLMLLPSCSYIVWLIHRLQSEIRGVYNPVFMRNQEVNLSWCYGAAAASRNVCSSLQVFTAFLLHRVCTTPCQIGFETGFVENEALDLVSVTLLPDQLPALTISVDKLGSSGTTRKWEHYIRITPTCKSRSKHGVCKHRGSNGLSRRSRGHAMALSLVPLLLPYPCCSWGSLLLDVCCAYGGPSWRSSSFLQHIRCAHGKQQALGMERCSWSLKYWLHEGPPNTGAMGQS